MQAACHPQLTCHSKAEFGGPGYALFASFEGLYDTRFVARSGLPSA